MKFLHLLYERFKRYWYRAKYTTTPTQLTTVEYTRILNLNMMLMHKLPHHHISVYADTIHRYTNIIEHITVLLDVNLNIALSRDLVPTNLIVTGSDTFFAIDGKYFDTNHKEHWDRFVMVAIKLIEYNYILQKSSKGSIRYYNHKVIGGMCDNLTELFNVVIHNNMDSI